MLGNLEASRASKEAIETLRGPVLEASERAGKRYAADAATAGEEAGSDEAEAEAEPQLAGDTEAG